LTISARDIRPRGYEGYVTTRVCPDCHGTDQERVITDADRTEGEP